MKVYKDIVDRIIAPEHLFHSWDEFKRGKRARTDVQEFEWKLEENISALYRDLNERTYRHGSYSSFFICDPKQRHIHKATVRDRIVHHAVFSVLNPIFEPTFIAHSFSCREGKGTHKAVDALEGMLRKVSRNGRRICHALQWGLQIRIDRLSVDGGARGGFQRGGGAGFLQESLLVHRVVDVRVAGRIGAAGEEHQREEQAAGGERQERFVHSQRKKGGKRSI